MLIRRKIIWTVILLLLGLTGLMPVGSALAEARRRPSASAGLWQLVQPTATPEELQVSFNIQPGDYTVGDVITLTLEVKHPAGYRLIPLQIEGSWGDFEARSTSAPKTVTNSDGSQHTTQIIEVTLWAPGTYTTPELQVPVVDAQGEAHYISAPPIELQINSLLTEDDQELRDIKPQAQLPLPPAWLWVVAVLLGAGLVFAAVLWIRRRRQFNHFTEQIETVDLRKPHEIAFDELDRIEAQNLLARGRLKTFYTDVSEVMRRYLEEAYQIATLERTTGEIKRAFKRSSLSLALRSDAAALLEEADLVKFARVHPEVDQAQGYLPRVRTWIEQAIPQEVISESDSADKQAPGAVNEHQSVQMEQAP